jgi:hypothetical protein
MCVDLHQRASLRVKQMKAVKYKYSVLLHADIDTIYKYMEPGERFPPEEFTA